jgi:hypothetical protein
MVESTINTEEQLADDVNLLQINDEDIVDNIFDYY